MTTSAVSRVALREHAARLRRRPDLAEAPILSATGLWLLLGAVAEAVEDAKERAALESVLGVPATQASAAGDPHLRPAARRRGAGPRRHLGRRTAVPRLGHAGG